MFLKGLKNKTGGAAKVDGVVLQNIDHRPKMWWHYHGLRTLNILMIGAIICQATNGYDGSMLNGLQSVDSWQTAMGKPTGTRLGTITNGTRYGQLFTLFFVAQLVQRTGRRLPIVIGSLTLLLGIGLQAGATGYPMFVVARVLIGIGNTIQDVACPILAAELAYPSQRTTVLGVQNTMNSLGQIMAAWITYGAAYIVTAWAWRLPSLLQAVTSIVQLTMAYMMPESPRWLVAQGRSKDAYKILAKYHAEGDESSQLLQWEMAEIEAAIEIERAQQATSWKEWVRTPANRYRLFILIVSGFMIQWCGNALITYYIHLVFNSIGITNSKKQLQLNGGVTISGFCFGMFWSLWVDRLGRRVMLMTGMCGMFVAFFLLTVFTGVNTVNDYSNEGLGRATIFTIFLFGAFYKMAGVTMPSYVSEIAPFELRAKAFVLAGLTDACASIFSNYTNPIGLAAITWKYYIVWDCVLISNFCFIYFFFPETKNLSLEEVSRIFEGDNSASKAEAKLGAEELDMAQPEATHVSEVAAGGQEQSKV